MGAFKNALKKILPPPVNSFMREVNRIVALEEKNQELMNQLIDKMSWQQQQIELQNAAIEYQKKLLKERQTDIMAEFKKYETRISYLENVVKQIVILTEESKENTKLLLQMEKELQTGISELQDKMKQKQQTIENYLHDQIENNNKLIVEQKNIAKKQYDEQQRINKDLRSSIDNTNKEITYHYFKGLHPDQYKEALEDWYYQKTGTHMDIDNPKTFNEKIQWLKLYDSTPEKTRLADKYLVREWVAEKIGEEYLIPLLGVYDKFDDIDFDVLPNQFVMKANHGSGWNIVVKDKEKFDVKSAKSKFDSWMKKNFAFCNGLELHYKNIEPKIIIEQYHPCEFEYQFWCFNGDAKFISAIHEPHGSNEKITYDLDWNKQNFVTSLPILDYELELPLYFGEMKSIVNKISKYFTLVRIDFLHDGTKFFIGELTFTPASGLAKWNPQEQDFILGENFKV